MEQNSEDSSDATESPEQRKNWNKMDMYVNPTDNNHRHQNGDEKLTPFKQPTSTKSSLTECSPYVSRHANAQNDTNASMDDMYSPMLGEITTGIVAGVGFNSGFPVSNDRGSRFESLDKPPVANNNREHRKSSSLVDSPCGGGIEQIFETGADGISGLGASFPGSRGIRDRVNTRKYERIDRIAMKLFPIIFILFNVCYWSYYLLLHETFQELW